MFIKICGKILVLQYGQLELQQKSAILLEAPTRSEIIGIGFTFHYF